MSRLKERLEKNCLNCNTEVAGRYCQNCGQENLETKESVWHLISHFFKDITHFDGKFFSTLKYLITKPGFVSKEYMIGRRASYVNPVRMYIFTSFVFFLIFFSKFQVDKKQFELKIGKQTIESIDKMDSLSFNNFTKTLNKGEPMSREDFKKFRDTLQNSGGTLFGGKYQTRSAYDSGIRAGIVKDNWLKRNFLFKGFEITEKYRHKQGELFANLFSMLMHNFPTLLFISLPMFALFLKVVYYKKKGYLFVSHGIYAIHLYIVYFIMLLIIIFLSYLNDKFNWTFAEVLIFLLFIGLFFYEYKAMRNFYIEGRLKTIFKFLLAFIFRLAIIFILFTFFLIFSFLKV